MKLIKQTHLFYKKGSSDKVYEVDLCEVGDDQYVVNFRYGRRGANLTDGSKTPLPVTQAKAEQIFEKLVASKTQKGYREAGGSEESGVDTSQSSRSADENEFDADLPMTANPAHRYLLRKLKETDAPAHRFSRTLWRIGEVALPEALEPLVALASKPPGSLKDDLSLYSLMYALGRSAAGAREAGQDVTAALKVAEEYSVKGGKTGSQVRRIAAEAYRMAAGPEELTRFRLRHAGELPPVIADTFVKGDVQATLGALRAYLKDATHKTPEKWEVLPRLYLINDENAREALAAIIPDLKLEPGPFRALRHIYKLSEARQDPEFFSLLAYRFEKTRAMYNAGYYYSSLRFKGEYVSVDEKEKKSPHARAAYSSKTRPYLRRRSWRKLNRLARMQSPEFVKLAAAILLRFSDKDAVKKSKQTYWSYTGGDYRQRTVHYDDFAPYHVFNQILYYKSPRYEPGVSLTWRCKGSYKPGQTAPLEREEAYPELWDQSPETLLELILKSECKRVCSFAVRALSQNTEYIAGLDENVLIQILERPYKQAAKLAFGEVERRAASGPPSPTLAVACAAAALEKARIAGRNWVDQMREAILGNAAFLVTLADCPFEDTGEWFRALLLSADLDRETAREFVGRGTALLMTLKKGDESRAKRIGDILLVSCGRELKTLGMSVVNDLLGSALAEVQEFTARVLIEHEAQPDEAVMQSLMASPHAGVRSAGVRLMGRLADEELMAREDVLFDLARHKLSDMRAAVRPMLVRLAANHEAFGKRIASRLVVVLLKKGEDGVLNDTARLLLEELLANLRAFAAEQDSELVWRLLRSKNAAAWQVGGALLMELDPAEFDVRQIVKLGEHEILSVREAAWSMFERQVERLRDELPQAVKMMESSWEDTRKFSFQFFREKFDEKDFSPETLVSICDSVYPLVQQFGRELVTKYFQDDNGEFYLTRLSEHPELSMQSFVTNYLERFARDNPAGLAKLGPYFLGVFSRVNRGRTAKKRIFNFLSRESLKDEASARTVAELMARVSAVCAVGERARAIEILAAIGNRYPEIQMPLSFVQPESRARRGVEK